MFLCRTAGIGDNAHLLGGSFSFPTAATRRAGVPVVRAAGLAGCGARLSAVPTVPVWLLKGGISST